MRLAVTRGFSLVLTAILVLPGIQAKAGPWITGYYPQYEAAKMPVSRIDFTTVTHAVHFCLEAESDGSITAAYGLTPAVCGGFVTTVHGAGRQALICVGGAGSESGFQGATAGANLSRFVTNLVSFMSTNQYDGIDIDWEPLGPGDVAQYTNFVRALRAAMNGVGAGKILTVAAPANDAPDPEFAMFASLQGLFDQINIMTYDMSGPWEGWVTWHNSPVTNGGNTFPSTGGPLPSINGALRNFTGAGVAPAKLGIGLPFYGDIWTGGPGLTQPRQGWGNGPAPTVTTATYAAIINTYYQAGRYHWDNSAQAAYLSVTNSPPTNDLFISYDDAESCQVKVSDIRNLHLGGLIIWELSQDYSGGQSPLLQSLHQALATPEILGATVQGGKFAFTFSTLPLATYRVWWANDPDGPWQTLTNNIPGTGAAAQVIDPAGLGATVRFYRVQTPP